MPQLRVKSHGKFDEQMNAQEKETMAAVIQENKGAIMSSNLSEQDKQAALKFSKTVLEEYITALHKIHEEVCNRQNAKNECKLDSTTVIDNELQALTEVVNAKKEKGVIPQLVELAEGTILMFQDLSHKKNAERLKEERRGERSYDGMYA